MYVKVASRGLAHPCCKLLRDALIRAEWVTLYALVGIDGWPEHSRPAAEVLPRVKGCPTKGERTRLPIDRL